MRLGLLALCATLLASTAAVADTYGSATGGTAATLSDAAGCQQQTPSLSAGQQAAISCDASGNLKITGSVTTNPTAASPTDRSLTLTTGGTSQTLAAANVSRKCLVVQNPVSATAQGIATAEDLYVNNNGAAAVVGNGSNFADLAPGASASFCFVGLVDQTAIGVNAATTGHRVYAKEY